ncbi:MAG: cytoplasmic protein [Nitrospirae bacterium]|nr:cytoplasmic protein [Nitrospirota bacterium]
MRSLPPSRRPSGGGPTRPAQKAQPPQQSPRLQASLLYCPTCRQAMPTREHLLLVLADGALYDYRCARCGTSTGSRTEKAAADVRIHPA